nr:efflux RND transporter permease subunit [uncultured Pseudomonas sp.]
MARFFIDRPIFAWVLAIVIMLAGLLSITQLSLEQYPNIAPTQIRLTATYPGASAKTIENSVTQVIEQGMTGLENLTYMAATSSSAGTATITLTFAAGTDPNTAQMLVQNKVDKITSRLPDAVQSQGIEISASSSDFLMVLSLVSADDRVTAIDIGDYISSTLNDQISRVNGVGDVTVLGSSYAMRVWLDPFKLQQFTLMPSDISTALTAQNVDVSAGQLGALPATAEQQLNATITARSKLQTAEQFRAVVIKHASDGSLVTLGDIARVELGGESYDVTTFYNGRPSAGMAVSLATGANALSTAAAVKAKLAELEPYFPAKLKMHSEIGYDTTPFVKISIEEVVKTLFEAIGLVVLIMFLFMQNLRATLIPAVAVPVVLLGTFGVLALFGYSINTLTMFGMVLAIGLLVDDAIVVVENVERIIRDQGLSPREATRQSMDEIGGALVGIALVLAAVFVPMAFFGGSTGVIYRQFSITIVSSMALSVLVALTLTPALCASLLRSSDVGHHQGTGFFARFNRGFERLGARYRTAASGFIRHRRLAMLAFGVIACVLVGLFMRLPTSFLPDEDQGVLMAQIQLPPGATDARTQQVLRQFETYFRNQPDVAALISIGGMGSGGNSQNGARAFIKLKDWSERTRADQSASAIAMKATQDLASIADASIFVMSPPAVMGLGDSSGFDLQLKDLGSLGHAKMVEARNEFLRLARADQRLSGLRIVGLEDTPQLQIDIDDRKAGAVGLSSSDINTTLSTALGSSYVNDFVDAGRVKKVYVQADAQFRMLPQDIGNWYVRNDADEMVPLSTFASTRWSYGSPLLERYNGFASMEIVGQPATGVSSGTAMQAVEDIVKQLPEGVGFEWTGQSYQEQLSGSQAPLLYAVSILFVFLCLAALYESWSVPFSVILAVPLGVLGTVLATGATGQANDVYFQVALLTTVGLAAKNAILIVEFAKQLQEQGKPLLAATLEAAHLRLRPILMTSLAFMFGVLPLALSSGAGSSGRTAIGTGVLGGTLSAMLLGMFFVPLFFVLIRSLFAKRPANGPLREASDGAA